MAQTQDELPIIPPAIPDNIGKFCLEPINHGLAASVRVMLKQGVSANAVIEMLLNHTASVVAMVNPPQVRATTVEAVVEGFANLVRQHVDVYHTSAGGVVLPSRGLNDAG